MQKFVFVLVLFVFVFGTAIGLGFLMEKYELVAFLLSLLGTIVCSTAVGAVLLWALEPTIEEDEIKKDAIYEPDPDNPGKFIEVEPRINIPPEVDEESQLTKREE